MKTDREGEMMKMGKRCKAFLEPFGEITEEQRKRIKKGFGYSFAEFADAFEELGKAMLESCKKGGKE